jgi:hypothetical protein
MVTDKDLNLKTVDVTRAVWSWLPHTSVDVEGCVWRNNGVIISRVKTEENKGWGNVLQCHLVHHKHQKSLGNEPKFRQ